ncbi:uncharacterized protein GGS22DRAFT_186445 [Annulohypoxylon maeteangense]|uniref:uncharacterized protein n=1 Tax=Annulohypoxylon maeteangense TaxID=1927788 RepID=UPI002008230B|nr:uncharacterized protein GGS22DRAFT_186445 [Annulohypoxylon maeteangense]KAI0887612.1 hypothetical protein GGS22DRAFT_186445 [Annulohypoxylon maeteangense]
MELRSGKVCEAAKAMATDRRAKKLKNRQIRRWVIDRYESNPADDCCQSEVDGSDVDSSAEKPAPPTQPRRANKRGVWSKKASLGGKPGPRGVTLRGMLGAAKSVYSYAGLDLDKMSLYDHISYILSQIKDDETPLPKTIVSREVVVMAQHQQHFARENLGACLAMLAIGANVTLLDLNDRVKICENCFSRFRYPVPRFVPEKAASILQRPCEYHPGQLRSFNDALDESDKTRKLGGGFLSQGQVKLEEFKLWISTCYWDCCGGKLLEVDPASLKRSQRKKRDPPKAWEIPNPHDGKVGCVKKHEHIPILV